jgi:phospholipase C
VQFPLQTAPHIGDRLDAAGVSWAFYYSGPEVPGLDPFRLFADTADGTPAAAAHIKTQDDFVAALGDGTLPNVAFVVPEFISEHPADPAGLLEDDQQIASLVAAVQNSSFWQTSAIIVTYDESGGFYDHVAPPVVDRWGPSVRVPAIIISPYAKKGFVDKTVYDTTSILRFIEWRWNLPPLGTRDASVNNLLNAFDFSQTG